MSGRIGVTVIVSGPDSGATVGAVVGASVGAVEARTGSSSLGSVMLGPRVAPGDGCTLSGVAAGVTTLSGGATGASTKGSSTGGTAINGFSIAGADGALGCASMSVSCCKLARVTLESIGLEWLGIFKALTIS